MSEINAETQAVILWLDNTEDLYDEALRIAARFDDDDDANSRRYDTGKAMEETFDFLFWPDGDVPAGLSGLALDIYTQAVHAVEWYDVAAHFIDSLDES